MIKFIQKLFGSIRWKVIKSFWLLFQTVSANGWSLTVFSSQKKHPAARATVVVVMVVVAEVDASGLRLSSGSAANGVEKLG